MSPWLRRRLILDRLVAAVLLVPVAPVVAILALLVRRGDGGPALVRVPRVGRSGNLLGMWKLRSMRASAPGGLAGGADLTARDDDRVTPIGARLRRWRLDELPQLVNVVRGEMALIGPRPEAPGYVDLADDRWRTILSTPPGIAGATQILVNRWEAEVLRSTTGDAAYRHEILPVKVALDEWYVRCATPALDLLILRSLARTLAGRGAPRLRARAGRAVRESSVLPHA